METISGSIVALLFAVPFVAFADIGKINGLGAEKQFLVSTTSSRMHLKIAETGKDMHAFLWDGTPWLVNQGGTGAATFTNGSLFFFANNQFSEDNSNLFWDRADSVLGIGTNTLSADSAKVTIQGSAGHPLLNIVSSLGAAKFFIDANGNIGVGNTSPKHSLDVSGAIYSRLVTLADAPNVIVDWSQGNVQIITLTVDTVLTFINGQPGGMYTLILHQDVAGNPSIIWPANAYWSNGTLPTFSKFNNSKYAFSFAYDGTDYVALTNSGQNQDSALPPPPAPIAFEGSSGVEDVSANDFTFALQVKSVANRMLLVGIATEGTDPDSISGVTYADTPMKLLQKVPFSSIVGSDEVYLFALAAPVQGDNAITVKRSVSGYAAAYAVLYSGVDQNLPTNVVNNVGADFSPQISINVSKIGSWTAGVLANNMACSTFEPPGIVRGVINCARHIFDSGSILVSGPHTFYESIYQRTSGPAWGAIAIEMQPAK